MAAFVHLVSFSCQSLGGVRRRRSNSPDVANSESRRQNGRAQLTAVQVRLPPTQRRQPRQRTSDIGGPSPLLHSLYPLLASSLPSPFIQLKGL